jgi:hypothetical protein
LGIGWLRTWDWPKLLSEYRRVCGLDGIVRITEPELGAKGDFPGLVLLTSIVIQALHRAGHLFTPTSEGLTSELAHLLVQHGLQGVQTHTNVIPYGPSGPQRQSMLEDSRLFYRNILPFLRKWTHVPDDYERIYQQAMTEIEQPGFAEAWRLLTVWGSISSEVHRARD